MLKTCEMQVGDSAVERMTLLLVLEIMIY